MTGIVILNYNNSTQTLACIESLKRHCDGNDYRICVVDNASTPEELSLLRAGCREHLIEASENKGYASGNDIGIEYFDSDPQIDSILILNDDTLFTENIITPMRAYLLTHADCGVVFPLVFSKVGSIDPACMRHSKTSWDLFLQATALGRLGFKRKEFISKAELCTSDGKWKTDEEGAIFTAVPPGSCMMLRKDVFKAAGWLDPGTFLYFEEQILSDKLRAMGLRTVLLPEISIIHLGAQSTSKQGSYAVYNHWRNSYLYYLKKYSKVPRIVQSYLRFRTMLKLLKLK